MKIFSQFISIVFHPLFTPTYVIWCVSYRAPALLYPFSGSLPQWIVYVFTTTSLLPMASLLFFRSANVITNFALNERNQRFIPLLCVSSMYVVFTYVLHTRFPPTYLLQCMIIASIMIGFSTAITFFYKISLHSLSTWGSAGLLLSSHIFFSIESLLLPAIVAILVAGLVSSARLALNAHYPDEVTTGGILGFVIGFFGVIVLL